MLTLFLFVFRLGEIEGRRQQLTFDLSDFQKKKKQTEEELKRSSGLQTSTVSPNMLICQPKSSRFSAFSLVEPESSHEQMILLMSSSELSDF